MAANHVIPRNVINCMYSVAFHALDRSYLLQLTYVAELKSHEVVASSVPLNLGEGAHFKHLGKPRGTSTELQDFLTIAYKGAYALFLGTSIMAERSNTTSEKNQLLDVKADLINILTRLYWQLKGRCLPVPKASVTVDKNSLRKKLENLIKLFLRDRQVKALVPSFVGRETLLLKWGLNLNYITCLSEFMSKVRGRMRRHTI